MNAGEYLTRSLVKKHLDAAIYPLQDALERFRVANLAQEAMADLQLPLRLKEAAASVGELRPGGLEAVEMEARRHGWTSRHTGHPERLAPDGTVIASEYGLPAWIEEHRNGVLAESFEGVDADEFGRYLEAAATARNASVHVSA